MPSPEPSTPTERRVVHPLPVPTGTAALTIVPALRTAMTGTGPALLPVPAADSVQSQRIRTAVRAGEPLDPGEDAAADPTALVIATSGSTGTPKGVLLSVSALRASADATHRALDGPGHWLLAMPAHHIAGIQVLMRAIRASTEPHAVDTNNGFRPAGFATAAHALPTDAPRYTALVPTQLGRLLDDADGRAALRSFDAVLLGGAATSHEMLRRATAAGVRVVTTYGMSETAGGCVYDGTPLDTARVRVAATHPEESGPILLSGPMRARGYRDQPDTNAFAEGWFHTGDLGRWQDGKLHVLGRADDVIVTGGVNIAPNTVEQILTAQPGVQNACVVGVPDTEWGQAVAAVVVPYDRPAGGADGSAELSSPHGETGDAALLADLRAAVRAQADAACVPKRFLLRAELPMRGPGKPDRRALVELFSTQHEDREEPPAEPSTR